LPSLQKRGAFQYIDNTKETQLRKIREKANKSSSFNKVGATKSTSKEIPDIIKKYVNDEQFYDKINDSLRE
jgi:hypothetical protein